MKLYSIFRTLITFLLITSLIACTGIPQTNNANTPPNLILSDFLILSDRERAALIENLERKRNDKKGGGFHNNSYQRLFPNMSLHGPVAVEALKD